MQTLKSKQKDCDHNADVYCEIEKTQSNIAFFESKNGKQRIHNFLNKKDSLNGSHLALWAWGQVHLQKKLHQKANRLSNEVIVNC